MSIENKKQYPNNKFEHWIAYRESPEFLRGIKSLEDLKGYSPNWKVGLLAVALNIKKGSSVPYIKKADCNQIEQVMSDLGIFFNRDEQMGQRYLRKFPDSGPLDTEVLYQVGATQEDLEEVMRVDGVFGDTDLSTSEYGRAMDYPETAVLAYERAQETGDNESLLNIYDPRITEDEQAFTNSRLSEENWEEEIQWREQIMAGVLEYSPKLYTEVIEDFQSYLEKKREKERAKTN